MRLKRIIQVGVLLGATGGTLIAARNNDWDISTIGLMRLGRAVFTVASIGIDYKINLRGLDSKSEEYEALLSQIHKRSAQKLLVLCKKNGGSYIKVGQHVGALEYLLPLEYVNTMKVLHSGAPQSSFKDILEVIRQDFNKEPFELFSLIEPKPLGAASLAQVHRAVLKDGTVVAVKIQHPRVKKHSYVDMKTMELLVKVVSYAFPEFKFKWLADEMKKNLPQELDFINEGMNASKVSEMFKKFPWLKIPKIYWKFSSDRVLTMQYFKGGQVNDRTYMLKHNINVDKISHYLGLLYSEMIFVHGFVHCDPHPGNVLVSPGSDGPEIILLDHGLYTTLNDNFRIQYIKLWLSLLSADVNKIKEHARNLGVGDKFSLLACMVTARSWKSIQTGIHKIKVTDSETAHIRQNASQYIPQITDLLNRVPRPMILLFKTNDLLRGIEYSLKNRYSDISFITMTKCCLHALYSHEINLCKNWICRFKVRLNSFWGHFRISLYEIMTTLKTVPFISYFSTSMNLPMISA